MTYDDLLDEVTEQWGGRHKAALADRFGIADVLVQTSMIAWNALASTPGPKEMAVVAAAAEVAGTRSVKPRIVLRRLIEYAQYRYEWVPTRNVLVAAGRKVR